MSRSRRAVAAVGVLLLVVIAVAVAWRSGDDTSAGDPASPIGAVVVDDVTDARAPFETLTAGTITVGGREVAVVLADSEPERVAGLRGRSDARPYAGMLFLFGGDTTTAFTMSGVPDALDIAFFSADGRRVDQLRMKPCAGTDATCPLYEASGPFRYALETAPGEMPPGSLRVR